MQLRTRLAQALDLITSRPDTSTEKGRGMDRYRRVMQTAGATAVARTVAIAAGLVTVPLTIDYLGAERYGLWMTVSSAVTLLSFADLGLGSGLLNAIAEAHGRKFVPEKYCFPIAHTQP